MYSPTMGKFFDLHAEVFDDLANAGVVFKNRLVVIDFFVIFKNDSGEVGRDQRSGGKASRLDFWRTFST